MQNAQILILANDAARRSGHPLGWPDQSPAPDLARIARAALETGLPVTIAVTPDRRAGLGATRARLLVLSARDAAPGRILAAGLAALPAGVPLILMRVGFGQMTATADLRRMASAWRATPHLILRAMTGVPETGGSETGRSDTDGPVCFPTWARADLMALQNHEGIETVLRRHAGKVRGFLLPPPVSSGDPAGMEAATMPMPWRAAMHPRPQGHGPAARPI